MKTICVHTCSFQVAQQRIMKCAMQIAPDFWIAVQEDDYLQTATMFYDKLNSWKADNYAYDWDNKSPALHVLLTQIFPSEMMK